MKKPKNLGFEPVPPKNVLLAISISKLRTFRNLRCSEAQKSVKK
jgi:hypothetical protein